MTDNADTSLPSFALGAISLASARLEHVRFAMDPEGGVMRLRLFGNKA
ncbi:hypothetical protein PY650_27610 [Rhizobium calliandrae]|uniref:Allantoicase n=1 Tax=Rhizobium calliandrae TaxID=1312182 RepID=A0ABT7KL18_9HYPH|nr:hypothetical protein [Rhizobium calliandrae]MDL2409333.1 hypothetical protein [Rhizobium calliandrae]